MSVPMGDTEDLCKVSIAALSDLDTIVAFCRLNSDLASVLRDKLDTALLQVFGEEVIGYEFEDGVLHVMVAEMPPQENIETAIDRLFEQFAH